MTSHCTLTTLGDEHADTAEKIEQNVNDHKNIKKTSKQNVKNTTFTKYLMFFFSQLHLK